MLEEVKGRRRFTWILLSQNAQVADVRDGVLVLAMAGVGPRDSFAKGGSEDILREALNEALGVDFRIEAIVDPSVTSGGRAGAGGVPAPTAASAERGGDPGARPSTQEPPDDPYEAAAPPDGRSAPTAATRSADGSGPVTGPRSRLYRERPAQPATWLRSRVDPTPDRGAGGSALA